jgi:hypothetical protein
LAEDAPESRSKREIRGILRQAYEKVSIFEAGNRLESGKKQACHFFTFRKDLRAVRTLVPSPSEQAKGAEFRFSSFPTS